MSARANPTVVGAFVVGAAVLLVAGLLFWAGTGMLRTKRTFVMYFDSAVTGLQKGAPVLLRGVRVGEVTEVQVRWGTPFVGVYVKLEPEALKGVAPSDLEGAVQTAVEQRHLRAQLQTQSFVTGVLYIAIDGFPDTPIVLRGLDKSVPELPTVPTDIERWTAKLEKISDAIATLPLDKLAQGMIATIDEAHKLLQSPEVTTALKNVNVLIADTRGLVKRVDTLSADLNTQIAPLSATAQATLKSAQTALAEVPALVEDVRRVVGKLDAQVDPLLTSLRKSSEAAQVTLAGVDGTLNQDSAMGYELVKTLRELQETSRALGSLADYLERNPDAPVYGIRRPGAQGGR